MALWVNPGSPIPTSADTDILSFYEGQEQPAGRSIMILVSWLTDPLPAGRYDWSRIVAVEVDEPYSSLRLGTATCQWDATAWDQINQRQQILAARATELESLAPFARFWVNFTDLEVTWMMGGWDSSQPEDNCPVPLNKSYIDVISVDIYGRQFGANVKWAYDWFLNNRATPHQQVALIPGTFYGAGVSADAAASYLPGYFDYANSANQHCDLPLGDRGITGNFDRCPVWIVMGWLSGNYPPGTTQYVGELDPTAGKIQDKWRGELGLPLRADLAHQLSRGQLVQTILPIMLHN
ncbi:MAG: hypothetical protein ACJ8R9_02790 [Steroidobacteraceae bacterium]